MESFGEYRIDKTTENMVKKYCLQPWQKKSKFEAQDFAKLNFHLRQEKSS